MIASVAIRFVLLLSVLEGGYVVEKKYSGKFIDLPYTSFTTSAANLLGKLLPFQVEKRGDIVLGSGHAAVVVVAGCNGLESILLLVAAVLAYPSGWIPRLSAILLFAPLLFLANLIRILGLLYVMAFHPQHIELFHSQVGQAVMALLVFLLWAWHVERTLGR